MDEQTVKIWNEKLKAISGILANGGLALLAATLGAIYLGTETAAILVWAFGGIIMLITAVGILSGLRPEN